MTRGSRPQWAAGRREGETNLYLLRHGECLAQVDPTYFTDTDSPLSPLGIEQARLTARYLSRVAISHVISSPRIRALATAESIAETKQLRVEVWPEVQEGLSHPHRDRPVAELERAFPTALFQGMSEQDQHHDGDVHVDWESRCDRVLARLRSLPDESHVALVSHGGVGNHLLHAALGLDFEKPCWFELANCGISRLRFVADPEAERPNFPLYPPVRVEVHSISDTAHLGVAL